MVEHGGAGGDSRSVPTIAELLLEYRDRTGASYEDMSRAVNREITTGRMHKLATAPPDGFPRPRTIELLSDLLQVSVSTTVLAFASGLGLQIPDRQPLLAITMPPGTEQLTDRDRSAVRAMIGQLVEARRAATDRAVPETVGTPSSTDDDASVAQTIDFPRRRYLGEAGEAARDEDK